VYSTTLKNTKSGKDKQMREIMSGIMAGKRVGR
jgi:hypothetical protein